MKTHAKHPRYDRPLCSRNLGPATGSKRFTDLVQEVDCTRCLAKLHAGVAYLDPKTGGTVRWAPFSQGAK